jgi:hypothetical protein
MTDYELSIGRGPDFAMTFGHMVYFHRAEMSISRENGKSVRLNMSHPSLIMLLRSIHGKLKGISGSRQVEIDWILGQTLEGVFRIAPRSVTVVFRFPLMISHSQRAQLTKKIQYFFKESN